MLTRLAALIDPATALLILAQTGAIGIGFWLARRRLRGLWRNAAFALLAVLGLRLALFGNPVAWGAYFVLLQGHADWRQTDIIAERYRALMPAQRDIPFLAVGSSQTHAIYRGLSRDREDLQLFSLAGMTPMDMALYRDRILSLRPRQVLLYISEFDLAAEARPEWARLAPVPLSMIPDRVAELQAALTPEALPDLRRDLILGDLLPEYRYNFVFRGLLTRAAMAAHLPGFRPERSSENDYAALHARAGHSMQGMARLLENFIGDLHQAGIGVVLVEGQYNPQGETPDLRRQHERFDAYLAELEQRQSGLTVLRRSDLPPLRQADFDDAYHLSPEAGRRFATAILETAQARRSTDRLISRAPASAGGQASDVLGADQRAALQ